MFCGTIIHADGIGKQLGYPTANLDCPQSKVRWKTGIYAAKAYLNKKEYNGALVIQDTPTWKVEVHLLDYVGPDIYGQELEVSPVQKVSELEKYENRDELIKKIGRDVELVRQVLNER